MENDDDFFHIGEEFTDPPKTEDVRKTNEKILKEQEKKLTDLKNEEFVIRVNPTDTYPNPDTTGNGIDCRENLHSVEQETINDVDDDSINKINLDMYKRCLNILKETDQALSSTYEKHKFDVNKRKYIDILFRKALQSNYSYVNCKYTYKKYFNINNMINMFNGIRKSINSLKFEDENTYLKSIRLLGNEFLNKIATDVNANELLNLLAADKREESYDLLSDIVGWEIKHNESVLELSLSELIATKTKYKETKKFIGEVIDDTMYVDNFVEFQENMIKSYQEYKLNLKKYYPDLMKQNRNYGSSANDVGLFSVLSFLYYYLLAVCQIAIDLNVDFQNIMYLIEPNDNNLKTNARLVDLVETDDAWISSDYHLLAEMLKGTGKNISRSEEIIRMHNKYVKPDDLFFFLGDISEQEFFDINDSKNKEITEILINLCKSLNGKKIMITGNNDTAPDSFYKKLGFIEIYREPILLERHVFSHEPIDTEEGILNVHGHIHGSKEYWNVDFKDHIDAYYGIYGHPVKLSYLDDFYNSGKYKGCKTVLKDEEE